MKLPSSQASSFEPKTLLPTQPQKPQEGCCCMQAFLTVTLFNSDALLHIPWPAVAKHKGWLLQDV